MPVRTDVALLAQRIRLPDGVERATWIVLPVGRTHGGVPGPTDTRLYALLSLTPAGWQAIQGDTQAGPPRQSVTIPEAAAAIVPGDALATLPRNASGYVVEGEAYPPEAFDLGPYRGQYAVRLGDGLLVCLQTQ